MKSVEDVKELWYEAHTALREYLEPFSDIEYARSMASKACGYWVQAAADGMVTPYGPYAQLYASAVYVLQHQAGLTVIFPVETLESAVPVDNGRLPYSLSRLYNEVWFAAQLLHWDRKTVHRAAKGLSQSWPSSSTTWSPLGVDWLGGLVLPLARRAFDVVVEHKCLDCVVCQDFSVRWENDDKRTEEWKTNQRLARLES